MADRYTAHKINVPTADANVSTRLYIDHNRQRRAYTLSLWRIETENGNEIIPLSSGRYFELERTERRSAARLQQLAAALQPYAETIARMYVDQGAAADGLIRTAIVAALTPVSVSA